MVGGTPGMKYYNICPDCQESFFTNRRDQIYCSVKCQKHHQNPANLLYMRNKRQQRKNEKELQKERQIDYQYY
jgi:hypothetical protein